MLMNPQKYDFWLPLFIFNIFHQIQIMEALLWANDLGSMNEQVTLVYHDINIEHYHYLNFICAVM